MNASASRCAERAPMMKALRRQTHRAHRPRRGWTAGIALTMWPAAGSAPARAASATTATTSVSAIGPGGVHQRVWVSQARPGAPMLVVVNGGPGDSRLAAPPAGELLPPVPSASMTSAAPANRARRGTAHSTCHTIPRRAEPAPQRYRGHVMLVFGPTPPGAPASRPRRSALRTRPGEGAPALRT